MQGISPNPNTSHSLQEHDYIGLSNKPAGFQQKPCSGTDDTDLRLGPSLDLDLGLGLGSASAFKKTEAKAAAAAPVASPSPSSSAASTKPSVKRGYSEIQETSEVSQEPAVEDPSPPKCQVVGWPPVRCYRRNALASKPAELFVKVNMDGITVGRKVDLNAYTSYESLQIALEEMFQPSVQGASKHFLHSKGSDFVLTYEDKDGDWMLVGDVPWSMFVSTVKRLRIARGSETNNSSPRFHT